MNTKSLILLGAVGCGKGTQAKLISDTFGFKIIGVGDILRNEQYKDTERGRFTKNQIGTGNLFPDEFINELMIEVMSEYINSKTPFVLEGYPRTINQAQFMDSMLKIDKVIYIDVSDEESLTRLIERGKTSGRQDDSSPEIIKHRLQQFKEVTFPIKEHYEKIGILSSINGEQAIDNIFNEIKNIIS